MAGTKTCPQCGAALPPDAPEGLCRACLLKRGLETNTVGYTEQDPAGRWTPPSIDELAARFPELEITRLLGRGGMGAVYQARQKNLDRIVALKILPPEMGHDAAFAERFTREAQAMARLNHPHIVAIHEFGQRSGQVPVASGPNSGQVSVASGQKEEPATDHWPLTTLYYFVMEYVDGVSLRGLLDSGHISPKEALAIVPQICEALQYAHDQGIVHRDIKPENILLSKQGQVKIADFGLAKLIGRTSSSDSPSPLTTGNYPLTTAAGTPNYMAPEQTQHPDAVDHRADIYSLGVVFYQMLTGELPLGHFAPPSKKVLIDVRLDEVVLRALEREPEKRYQQASEVKTEVETIATTPAADHSRARKEAVSAGPGPGASASNSRFSRLAIVGAVWSTFGILLIPLLAIAVNEYHPGGRLNWIGVLLSVTLLPLGISAFFGTTLLGLISLSQIRHSAGRLYGADLALLDALLFPLLALDAFLVWASCLLTLLYGESKGLHQPWTSYPYPVLWMALATAACVWADALIIHWAWRAANKPITPSPSEIPNPQSASPPAAHIAQGPPFFALHVLTTLLYLLAALIAVLPFFVLGLDPGDPHHLERFILCPLAALAVATLTWVLSLFVRFLLTRLHNLPPRPGRRLSAFWLLLLLLIPAAYVVGLAIDRLNSRQVSHDFGTSTVPPALSVPPSTPESPPAPAFGPAIERTVKEAIDLDSGKLATIPNAGKSIFDQNQSFTKSLEEGLAWAEQNGMDACSADGGSLCGLGMKVETLPNAAWDTMTVPQLQQTLAGTKAKPIVEMKAAKDDSPATYAFQTREGGLGLLQILPSPDIRAKIRYKLVQPSATRPATPASHPAPTAAAPLKLQSAEEALRLAEAKEKAGGLISEIDYLRVKADRDIAAAELTGDPAVIARAKFDAASEQLRIAKVAFKAGLMEQAEYQKFQLDYDLSAAATHPGGARTGPAVALPLQNGVKPGAPDAFVESMKAAVESGDVKKVRELMVANGETEKRMADVMAELTVRMNEVGVAAEKRFGNQETQLLIAQGAAVLAKEMAAEWKVEGDRATPRTRDQNFRLAFGEWTLLRVSGEWRMEMSVPKGLTQLEVDTKLKTLARLAGAWKKFAKEIDEGRYQDVAEVKKAMDRWVTEDVAREANSAAGPATTNRAPEKGGGGNGPRRRRALTDSLDEACGSAAAVVPRPGARIHSCAVNAGQPLRYNNHAQERAAHTRRTHAENAALAAS